jgi:hypothetical protein
VAWGDVGYAFTTTSSPLSLLSSWTYDTSNSTNFTRAWTTTTNAEMGIVQTRPGDKTLGYQDRVVGRERGTVSSASYLNKGDCTGFSDARNYSMPCVNGWPYQLMNYDWDGSKPLAESTGTKLMAWGSPYGLLGASSFDLFDYSGTADGRTERAYATFIVLGPRCRYGGGACNLPGDVTGALATVEALSAATLAATVGALATAAPRGPGASQQKSLANGYDDTFAGFTLEAAADEVQVTFTPAPGKSVKNPIFRVRNYSVSQLPQVSVDGAGVSVNDGTASSGAFVSYDATAHELWVTLNRTLTNSTVLHIGR